MKKIIVTIAIFTLPIMVLGQSDGTAVPTQTPMDATTTPAQGVSAPRVTTMPAASPTTFPSPTPRPSPSIFISPTVQTPAVSAETDDRGILMLVSLSASALAFVVFIIYKAKTNKTNSENGRCDSIKELLEQKKKELEEFVRNWPEEKIKALAKERALGELKKDHDAKRIIETAESLKAKHDKLKETIELLQKRYDLCMLVSLTLINKKIFIYGVPGSGKTYISKRMADNSELPLLEADVLKEELRKFTTREESPFLFLGTCQAYKYFGELNNENAIKGLNSVRRVLAVKVKEETRKLDKIVMEGAFLDPNLIKDAGKMILVIVADEEQHRKNFFEHRERNAANEEEFRASRMIQGFLISEAKDLGIEVLNNE